MGKTPFFLSEIANKLQSNWKNKQISFLILCKLLLIVFLTKL